MTVVASNFPLETNNLYETEAWATEALLRHLPFEPGSVIWEPAAGNHMIADVIRAAGDLEVVTSDIATYARKHDFIFDFLQMVNPHSAKAEAIITNPPYGKGNRDAVLFAELALTRCKGIVALLLTAKFDFGKTRHHLFRDNPRFAAKIVLVDRIQWFPGATTGTEDHAWYVWSPPSVGSRSPRIVYEGKR